MLWPAGFDPQRAGECPHGTTPPDFCFRRPRLRSPWCRGNMHSSISQFLPQITAGVWLAIWEEILHDECAVFCQKWRMNGTHKSPPVAEWQGNTTSLLAHDRDPFSPSEPKQPPLNTRSCTFRDAKRVRGSLLLALFNWLYACWEPNANGVLLGVTFSDKH